MSSTTGYATDQQLVRACLEGSEDAWAALIDRYKNLIYAVPLRAGASPEDAAEVFQSVCTRLLTELPRLQRVESLRTWLLAATTQGLSELCEQQRRLTASLGAAESVGRATLPAKVLDELDRDQRVRDTVEQLPESCRQLVQLLFYEHPPRSYSAIARQLGLSTGLIGFIRGRGLKQLSRSLREAGVPSSSAPPPLRSTIAAPLFIERPDRR